MYFSVNDGKVIFATHLIHTTNIPNGFPFEHTTDLIICYSLEELEDIKIILQYEYTVEEIIVDSSLLQKVKGIKYSSKTEALKHINAEIEVPESEIIHKLQKEKDVLQQKLNETESALLTLMFGGK